MQTVLGIEDRTRQIRQRAACGNSEMADQPGVTDLASMYFFYKYNSDRGSFSSPAFETVAAIEAGHTVADEIGRFQRAR
jgi:hypothetical protein